MMVFRGVIALLLGIALLVDGATVAMGQKYHARGEFWCGILLVISVLMNLFTLSTETDLVMMGGSCGVIFSAALFVYGYNVYYHHIEHLTKKDIRINDLEAQNAMLRSKLKLSRNMQKDMIKNRNHHLKQVK